MDLFDDSWRPFSWYCPNCTAEVTAFRDKEGRLKATCHRCRAVMVRTPKGRRHDTIEIYAPKDKVRIS